MASIGELQFHVDGLLRVDRGERMSLAAESAVSGERRTRMFSAFHFPDVQQAKELAAGWMQVAEEARGEESDPQAMARAVSAALEVAADAISEQALDPERHADLARHALKLFLTHYRHRLPIQIKGLELRAPWLILPSRAVGASEEADPESRLLWLREDPKLNEHHEHWHVVYPIAGVPSIGNPRGGVPKDRQGELFLYMHRQMLSRYDTERLAVGLPRVATWGYEEAEPYGYDPGPYLRGTYGPREPGRRWETTPEGEGGAAVEVTVQDMAERGQRLFEAAAQGHFSLPDGSVIPVDANLLGMTQEADIGTVETSVLPWDPNGDGEAFTRWYNALIVGYYGNFHNVGHDMFGWLSTNRNGVMGFVPTAMRDHVFYRWHKLIDDLYDTWQETQPSHDFGHDAPPVRVRKSLPGRPEQPNASPDIILCLRRDLLPWDRWELFGEYAFGGENWEREFPAGHFEAPNMPSGFTTTDELLTSMHKRVITIETGAEDPEKPEEPHEIEYLDQEELFYFLRLENESSSPQDVTVRIFLVAVDPVDLSEDRRMWIEMDKFKHSLAAGERAVVFRPAALSSVIRKPAVKPPTAEQPPIRAERDPMQEDADIPGNYCDCGWPYNLLLPRGTREGMRFRLLVMLSDWSIDHVPDGSDCGSMSYCGARDKYPDARPMGYPFDAPFRTRSISETIAAAPNMATRDIVIRWA